MGKISFSVLILVIISIVFLAACSQPAMPSFDPLSSVKTSAAGTAVAEWMPAIQATRPLTEGTPLFLATEGGSTPGLVTPAPEQTGAAARPTATPLRPSPTPTPAICERMGFVKDVTVPDGAKYAPGERFTKTWRLMNTGKCAWDATHRLVFDHGDAMGGPASLPLPAVAPWETIDISVELVAPAAAGKYKGYWILQNSKGEKFGYGKNGNLPFWAAIEVTGPTPVATKPEKQSVYDLVENACAAQWLSHAGVLPCPGSMTDSAGYVVQHDKVKLQDGKEYASPSLETYPQWKQDGVITGRYPPVAIKAGYRFKAVIGCQSQSSACDVIFQLNYRASNGELKSLGQWMVRHGSPPQSLDVSLSELAGSQAELVLAVGANGSAASDNAVWVAPRIVE